MKKVLIILMILACLFIFSGCGNNATEQSNVRGCFIKITSYDFEETIFAYDPFTKIVYVFSYKGLTPYYTIKFGEPVIAIYGVNWTEGDLIKGAK